MNVKIGMGVVVIGRGILHMYVSIEAEVNIISS